MAKYDIHIMESLPGVLENRGNEFIPGEQGTKVTFWVKQSTKEILGTNEHKNNNFRFLGNRETSLFISGEQGNGYSPRRVS